MINFIILFLIFGYVGFVIFSLIKNRIMAKKNKSCSKKCSGFCGGCSCCH